MKYIPPAGEAADASYVDGNRSAGTKGSVVPAAAVEHPQREIEEVISFFGLTPSTADLAQLRKAIEAAIDAATGAGDTSQYLLVAQARARLPIFPDVQSADGRVNVTSPTGGAVQVPTAVTFQHRGIYPVSTSDYIEADRTFTTVANKTYHLRWNPTDGFVLKDLADSGYNPSVLAEDNAGFDSGYDDMLIARIVTDPGNLATITSLVNKAVLTHQEQISGAGVIYSLTGNDGARYEGTFNLGWSRIPKAIVQGSTQVTGGPSFEGFGNRTTILAQTRYSVTAKVETDYTSTILSGVTGSLSLLALGS